ncbi:MAG: OB-fold nucleic acid binding domain-containing protein, partial [Beijerinckiaceae bacterium]
SAWFKCRYPDVFAAALINSQPMGFYAPSQILRDARDHGVAVRETDINHSDWDCTLEACDLSFSPPGRRWREAPDEGTPYPPNTAPRGFACDPGPHSARGERESIAAKHASQYPHIRSTHAIRLGFRIIKGVREDDMHLIAARRGKGYDSVRDVWLRTGLSPAVLERLAVADAFRSIGLDRRDALWAVRGLNRAGDKDDLELFRHVALRELEPDAALPPMPLGEHVVEDYRQMSLSLKAHPVSFLRGRLDTKRILRCGDLANVRAPRRVSIAGLVLVRQRPGTAKGVVFMTLEDETGVANVIVWPKVFEKLRPVVIGARFVAVTGRLQNEAGVIHVIAERMEDMTPLLQLLSDDGERISGLANADEVKRPQERDKIKVDATPLLPLEPANANAPPPVRSAVPAVATANAKAMPKGRNFH